MQLKSIDKNQKIYHYFKLSTIIYALFDDEMDMPVMYGSLNKVETTVESLRKHIPEVFIVYYDRDLQEKTSFKKNMTKTRINNKSK